MVIFYCKWVKKNLNLRTSVIFISLILFPCLRFIKKFAWLPFAPKVVCQCCRWLFCFFGGSLFRRFRRMYKQCGCTDRPNLTYFCRSRSYFSDRTQVNKLTKKYFNFFPFSVRMRSHCDSSHVLKNVAIPRAPVLLCSAYMGSPSWHALKLTK